MTIFQSQEEMYDIFGAAIDKALKDPELATHLREAGLIIRYDYSEPEGSLLVDCSGDRVQWTFGDGIGVEPNVQFKLSAETAHRFFSGRLNVPLALARRDVVFHGDASRALKLMPAMKPLFQAYREVLSEKGWQDLLAEHGETAPGVSLWSRLRHRLGSRRMPIDYEYAQTAYRVAQPAFLDPGAKDNIVAHQHVDPKEAAGTPDREMLEKMMLIRKFEEHLARSFDSGDLPTFAVHLSIGQEAVAAGACLALRPRDVINTTHRGHGHLLAKGADVNAVMAELYGKASGSSRGRGGSMHVIDTDRGIMGSNGIVGAGLVLGAGAALAAQMLRDGRVSLVFIGDGATNQGMFHEGLNFAAVKRLPLVVVIENNGYGEFTPLHEHSGITELWKRAASYGIPGQRVDGTDARAVYNAVREAANAARAGAGPALIECVTNRWRGHMEGDAQAYRTAEELAAARAQCPIRKLAQALEQEGVLDQTVLNAMDKDAAVTVAAAVDFALTAPDPEPSSLYDFVYAPDHIACYTSAEPPEQTSREVTVSQAINQTIAAEMRRDDRILLMGEDVTLGGYFSVTQGLVDEFGRGRIMDTPISENAVVGSAVGAAACGLRPIVELLFSDFLTTCLDPIVNQMAKMHYMSGGQVTLPLVLRMPSGSGLGMAAQHSQTLETLLVGIPGLTVVVPSDAFTAAGLLRSAIRSNNPVIFVEHKLQYIEAGPIGDGEPMVPLRKARVARKGRDITLVSYSYGVSRCLDAARRLAERGVDVEIVDLLTLYPLDTDTVLHSVEKTRRLAVVEEGTLTLGIGAEVVARVAECAWARLYAPPRRLAGKEVPVAYAKSLESLAPPAAEEIVDLCMKMMNG